MHRLTFPALLLFAALCTGAYVIHDRAERAEQPRRLSSTPTNSQSLSPDVERLPSTEATSNPGAFALVGYEEVERLPVVEDAIVKENPLRKQQPASLGLDASANATSTEPDVSTVAPSVSTVVPNATPAEPTLQLAPPLELRSALDRPDKPAIAPATIRRQAEAVDSSRVTQASARPAAEHRFSGVKDFHAPTEADPNWVVDGAEPTIPRESVLHLQLPRQVKIRTRTMLQEATAMADRGALYAARNQFLRIIRMTCQSLDAQLGRSLHTKALARGLRALDESDDFALSGDSAESDLQIIGFIAGHRTPVLKNEDPRNITSLIAMQRYYKYAYEQLSLAGNDEPAASEALFSLGRVESLLSEAKGNVRGGGPKALALFHAALTVNPHHGRAANELGVMLAKRGRMPEARNVLLQATTTSSNASAMRNLAVVQQYLGDPTSPATARRAEMLAARTRVPKVGNSPVQFVDPAEFNQHGTSIAAMPQMSPTPAAPPAANVPTPAAQMSPQPTTPPVVMANAAPAAAPQPKSLAKPFFKLPSRNRPAPRQPVRTATRPNGGSWDF